MAFLLAGCGAEVIAKVNGEKITESEFNKRMEQVAAMYGYDLNSEEGKNVAELLKDQMIQSMIEEKLVIQEAKNRKIQVNKEEIEEELEKIKAQFNDDEDFTEFLTQRKFAEKDLKVYIEQQLILNSLFDEVTKDVSSTTRDVKKYYDENQPEFYQAEQIKTRNIVVKTEEEAKAIIERLDKGEDFAQLAVELSIDPTAKDNQGELDYFDEDAPLVEEFKNAAFQLKVGQYTKAPVQSMFGYHVIKVEDKKTARQRTFEEVKGELEERFIMEEKNEKFSNFVDELLANAVIEKTETKEETPPQGESDAQDNQPPADTDAPPADNNGESAK